jgi:hypothetical protein
VEQRALQWEALAQQCIDNCGMAGPPTAAGGSRAAAAAAAAAASAAGGDLGDRLAAAVPFEVDSEDVEVQASMLQYTVQGTGGSCKNSVHWGSPGGCMQCPALFCDCARPTHTSVCLLLPC